MFEGPFFIVGRPRSGTKLLMSLLNAHSQISIPFWESTFIPRYKDSAEKYGNLGQFENFEKYFYFLTKIEFFRKIKENPKYTDLVDPETWFNAIDEHNYSGVISAFFKMYAERDNKNIWGDKSPKYMVCIKILKELFPECKVIHIIRDVRDQCLSSMKAWNKDPFLTAQLWSDGIKKCRKDAQLYCDNNEYLELKYEFLLDNPGKELIKICKFLEIEYEEKMLVLKKPAENIGDTKHTTKIVKENKYKWKTKMPIEMIKKIEMICFDMIYETGYEVAYATSNDRLKYFDFQVARVKDAWNRFKFDCTTQGGLIKAVLYQYMKRKYG